MNTPGKPRVNYGKRTEIEMFEGKPLLDQYFAIVKERDQLREQLAEAKLIISGKTFNEALSIAWAALEFYKAQGSAMACGACIEDGGQLATEALALIGGGK